MKIALIAASTIPARTANSIQVMKMAQALAGLDHQVRVYVPGISPGVGWPQLAAHYGLGEQQAFSLQWLPALARLRRYDYGLRAVQRARRWGADLIYTRLPQAAAFASWSAFPTIFEIHDLPQGSMGPRLLRTFLRGRGARGLVTITDALAAALMDGFPISSVPHLLYIAPDGVDLDRYKDLPAPDQARAALNLPEGFTVGYTGHLYPGRGIDLILKLAAQLPQINFLLAGGEPQDVARVQGQARSAGLSNLNLLGFVPNADLPRYQAACDVLLMPYQKKVAASSGGDISAFLSPMKMFEYLACGRAILASDLPVLQEVLSSDNAVILPAADESAWVTALQTLQSDAAYCRSLAAQARLTAQKYTWHARAAAILRLLPPAQHISAG
ncbi:MAG: glycosyltransferase [Anaerolineae bacterium]|nr:glycosyltransferase [Anaerolineae bacterium]